MPKKNTHGKLIFAEQKFNTTQKGHLKYWENKEILQEFLNYNFIKYTQARLKEPKKQGNIATMLSAWSKVIICQCLPECLAPSKKINVCHYCLYLICNKLIQVDKTMSTLKKIQGENSHKTFIANKYMGRYLISLVIKYYK